MYLSCRIPILTACIYRRNETTVATLVEREGAAGATDGARNAVGFVAVAAQDILIRSSKTISDRTATSSSADVTQVLGLIEEKEILHKKFKLPVGLFTQRYRCCMI